MSIIVADPGWFQHGGEHREGGRLSGRLGQENRRSRPARWQAEPGRRQQGCQKILVSSCTTTAVVISRFTLFLRSSRQRRRIFIASCSFPSALHPRSVFISKSRLVSGWTCSPKIAVMTWRSCAILLWCSPLWARMRLECLPSRAGKGKDHCRVGPYRVSWKE